jgi:hypothetical protein
MFTENPTSEESRCRSRCTKVDKSCEVSDPRPTCVLLLLLPTNRCQIGRNWNARHETIQASVISAIHMRRRSTTAAVWCATKARLIWAARCINEAQGEWTSERASRYFLWMQVCRLLDNCHSYLQRRVHHPVHVNRRQMTPACRRSIARGDLSSFA